MILNYHANYLHECPDTHKRFMLRIAYPYSGVIQINDNCTTNEYVSLMARHLIVRERDITPLVTDACKHAFTILRELYPPYPLSKYSYDKVILSKPPSMRRKARDAYNYILAHGLCRKDYKVRMFIKNERMSIRENGLKPPRAIQSRSTAFTIMLQRYIMPYAKKWHRVKPYPPILVGYDGAAIANILREAWLGYDDPVAILLDHRNFDSGVHTVWLQEEHQYFVEHFPNDPELPFLLKKQLSNDCVTSHGVRYRMKGTRCSGDADTSSGNSTINLATLCRLFRDIQRHIYNIGDDSVVITSRQLYNHLVSIGRFGELGRDYLWETPYSVVDQFESIEFCQCRPVELTSGWLMVRDPVRVLTRASYCIDQSINTVPMLKRWMRGVGMCEFAVNPGVPILQQFSLWMASHTSETPIYEPNYKPWTRTVSYTDRRITTSSRSSFERAFNISIDEQLRIEHFFAHATLSGTIQYHLSLQPQSLHSVKDE